jgi:para-aminobenzoate synthetase component 1
MLNWSNQFNICCFLDNNNYNLPHHTVECILAAGSHESISSTAGNALDKARVFYQKHNDWIFGHLAYDLKNEIEFLSSSNTDRLGFPDLFFFVPEYIIQLKGNSIQIGSLLDDHEEIFKDISLSDPIALDNHSAISNIRTRYSRNEYISVVEKLRQHILRGDCYEVNFCQEFYAQNVEVDPLHLFITLTRYSPNPFSGYYKINDHHLCCMSPERYLKKESNRVLSQPIKGTSRRNKHDAIQDGNNLSNLLNSEKERAENIMVVDLVRNDLSKICKRGTVNVDQLCAVYSFPHLHQMVSTISGEIKEDICWTDAVRATFPMGSMTGAPKKKVMELIDEYEITKRGLFSGSIGYVTPEGDFDFNVIIRSVLYNGPDKYLSYHTGSAITFNSDPEKEYEECLLKGEAIKKALAETNTFH